MKYTLAEMQEIHKRWSQSGLSRKAFCDQEGIAYHTFNYWHKRLTAEDKSGSGFVAINLTDTVAASFEVNFPSGTRIIFHKEPEVSWLRELVG